MKKLIPSQKEWRKMKQVTLLLLVMLMLFIIAVVLGCSEDYNVLPPRISTNEGNEVGANVLSYSGAVVLGAQQIAWT